MADREITFEIVEHIGVVSNYENGWTKEVNLVSWNGQPAKFDLRDWDREHERMSRGITLMPGEMKRVVDLYISNKNRKVIQEARADEEKRRAERAADDRWPDRQEDVAAADISPFAYEEPADAKAENSDKVAAATKANEKKKKS